MKVLVGCEFSGIVRDAFAERGHDAWSCDLLPTERPGNHIQDDLMKHLDEGWDLMIAHPPCTYLANSGVQYIHSQPGRIQKCNEAKSFFLELWVYPIPKVCIENPVPHKFASLPRYCQIIHPWLFGDKVMKRTCLWLRGLPPLFATAWVDKGECYITKSGKSNGSKWYQLETSKNRQLRSKTFPGIAKAMAEQWG